MQFHNGSFPVVFSPATFRFASQAHTAQRTGFQRTQEHWIFDICDIISFLSFENTRCFSRSLKGNHRLTQALVSPLCRWFVRFLFVSVIVVFLDSFLSLLFTAVEGNNYLSHLMSPDDLLNLFNRFWYLAHLLRRLLKSWGCCAPLCRDSSFRPPLLPYGIIRHCQVRQSFPELLWT